MKLFRKLLWLVLFFLLFWAFYKFMFGQNMSLKETVFGSVKLLFNVSLGILIGATFAAIVALTIRAVQKRNRHVASLKEDENRAAVWQYSVPFPPYPKKWWEFWKR